MQHSTLPLQQRTIPSLTKSWLKPHCKMFLILYVPAFFSCGLNQILLQIAMQDHLDGGISILIRCPGFKADTTPSPEDMALDLYVTPHELQESSARIGGGVAILVQAFCEEFVVPHAEHFMKCCRIEGIEVPHRCKLVSVHFSIIFMIFSSCFYTYQSLQAAAPSST